MYKQKWTKLLESLVPTNAGPIQEMDASEQELSAFASSDKDVLPAKTVKPLQLDSDGYPLDSADIARWAETCLADQIVVLPRAQRALRGSRHPDPRRISEALVLLAGHKLMGYRGVPSIIGEFESGLLKLRMRDGFSNAERLKGRTGADYVVEFDGRRLLLERHLCSNSSGFNDPRMIRIYYAFDKVSQKIIIGWLPSHLQTSKS